MHKQWTSSQDVQLAMSRAAEIRAGHRQGTGLVILHMEFSRSGQVKEVALVEYVSGRVSYTHWSSPKHLRSYFN